VVIENAFPISRDALHDKLMACNIFTRKYFYPLCSDYTPYKDLPSSSKDNLPVANDLKSKVLCLPFYGGLTMDEVDGICENIIELQR
jgi:dTDP-4-amino-4,6-dideoxygalactose transaminase